ncbi:MAG TPA: hypothetical protein VF631_05265 [Allosphingosinicella sp.]|uniref:hypothetical protein n=1 Tax=Allosphingosinicella sp. TaxID=2823234 RepID=UPI002F28A10A
MAERSGGELVSITKVRVREPVKAELERAARQNEWPLNREIQNRLEMSLELERDLGGRLPLFRLMAWAIGTIEGQHGGKLENDYWAFHRARGAIEGALNTIRPPLPAEIADSLAAAKRDYESGMDQWRQTAQPLIERCPHQAPANAFLPGSGWITVVDPRFEQLMTDEELSDAVSDLEPEVAALVREHQESIRRVTMARVKQTTLESRIADLASAAASEARSKTEEYDRNMKAHIAREEGVS